MSDIRNRLESHRLDVLVLMDETAQTARFHEGFRLAGAISHLARAHALLSEELDGLPSVSKEPPSPPQKPAADPDETSPEAVRIVRSKPTLVTDIEGSKE
jgi:hypothetical protein